MKILHIITGLDTGGAETVLYRLVTTDKENNHVVLSLLDGGVYGERLTARDIPVYTLNMIRGQINLQALLQIYRLVRKIDPDLVQTWMYHASLLGGVVSRIAGKRSVVWVVQHSDLDPKYISRKTLLVTRLCAYLSHVVPRLIIFCSQRASEIHIKLGYNQKKMMVIPNGYDANEFNFHNELRKRLRTEWDIRSEEILIGMVARWHPQKGHANLIAALAALSQKYNSKWRCVLVGPNIDIKNDTLVTLLKQYNVFNQVSLLGSRSDISSVMNAFDIHVLSSSFGEAFPNVVAEAMACGTPSIVTDVGDAAFIVGNTGWVVQPGNAPDLADAMHQAILSMANDDAWNERKIACRKRIVENFSLEKMIKSYNDVWRSISLK